MPFQYQPYEGAAPFVRSIGELLANQGQIRAQQAQQVAQTQARAAELSGQAYGGAVQQIGSTIGQIPQQMQAQKTRDLQMQDVKAQIDERNAVAAQRKAATDGLAAVDHIMKSAMVPDPQTGVVSFDRKVFEQGLAQSGQGHLYPQYAEMLDKLDSAASKRNADARSMIAQVIYGIHEHGDTPDAVLSGAAYLKANQLVTDEHLSPILGAIGANPTPANIKATLDKLTNGMPEYRQLVESEGKRKADLAKTAAETAKAAADAARATAEAKKTDAEVAGTLPQTPAQIETARHDQEMERIAKLTQGREAARDAEIRRHNLETEKAANPLAALTGQPGQQQQGPTGDVFLKTLPQPVAVQVKALAEGRMPFPSGMALKTPYWQGMITAVTQYDPSFDAVNYNARASTRKDFTSGKSAAQVNALNTVLGHLNGLSDAAEALNNTDYPALNGVLNTLSKAVGRPNVTNFNTIKKAVADEVTRVWRQAGGSVEDVKQAQENLAAANSPAQLRGAIATYGELLQSKLGSLQDQYRQGMGTDPVNMLRPENKAILDKIAARAAGADKPKVLKLVNGKLVPE